MSAASSSTRAFWVTAARASEIREESLPAPRSGEVLVRTRYSAVSRGTETLVYEGRVPASEQSRMRCPHQAGEFPSPVKYGYSSVGRVLAGPSDLLGREVFCLYPHQTAYVVPESAVLPLPEGALAERAVLAANLETCLNACWDAGPLFGDRVTIVGAGVIGCLMAYLLARMPGADVELVDVQAERETVARALGARFALPEAASAERDLVVHASATEAGLSRALELGAPDSTLVELSWFGAGRVALPLGGAFHARRLTIRSSQVGAVSPRARARFSHRERLALALELTRDPALDALFGADVAFEDLPQTLARLARGPSGVLCQRVRYPENESHV